eukprot:3879933-Prymnesium_polylepis.1
MRSGVLDVLTKNLEGMVDATRYQGWVDDLFLMLSSNTQMIAFAGMSWWRINRIFSSSANETVDFFSDDEIMNIKNAHASESLNPPERHKISMRMLPRILRRIADTRSNGNLVQGTDETVGFSVESLADK